MKLPLSLPPPLPFSSVWDSVLDINSRIIMTINITKTVTEGDMASTANW